MNPKIHNFPDTDTAYNRSQCDEEIHDGDVLVTPETVGILVGAWPVAVTGPQGEFHTLNPGITWETFEDGKYAQSAVIARGVR